MTGGEVVIPCPRCRAAVRSRTYPDGSPILDRCLICGAVFPPELLAAIRTFLLECFGELTPPAVLEPEAEPQLP
ncbi:MAG: hypothetical protein Kow001_20290 [Acidobacteriota bacterium]